MGVEDELAACVFGEGFWVLLVMRSIAFVCWAYLVPARL